MGQRLAAAAIAIVAVLAPNVAAAEAERILDFQSHIRIHADGSLRVTETIAVASAGQQIKRGIYRDIPTSYRGRRGENIRVGFEVLEVLRDGQPEPYFLRRRQNGERIYIGGKNIFLPPGRYTYTITYAATRLLGFFEGFDELYWNVTGNGWAFPIERVRVVIELPSGARVLESAAYTGYQGANGQVFAGGGNATGSATFETTRPLAPREGLTVAVSFPKGFVVAPTRADRAQNLLADNTAAAMGLAGFVILFAFYMFAWYMVGRDPAKGTIIPRFEPPVGFSPAALRFIRRMDFDNKAFAAAVVSMAVKGYLTVRERMGGEFALEKAGASDAKLSPGERGIARKLFGLADCVELKDENHKEVGGASKALEESLSDDFEKINFRRNRIWFVAGLGVTALVIAAMALTASDQGEGATAVIWVSIWTLFCAILVAMVVNALKTRKIKTVIFSLLFVIPFLTGEGVGVRLLGQTEGYAVAALVVTLALINVLFAWLMKAPTLEGRRLMDEIDGFRMYLSVAEKERMEILNPPDRTPELFEKYLPFALALDVEHEWSEQFADVMESAANDHEAYTPLWYANGHIGRINSSGLASSLGGALSGAIAASSTAPGSSSGSGGGGFSGGGGGGGGGGGW